MTRRVVPLVVVVATATLESFGGPALAQVGPERRALAVTPPVLGPPPPGPDSAAGPPQFTPVFGADTNGIGFDPLPSLFLEPLRLGLLGDSPFSRRDPDCAETADADTGAAAFATQRARVLQLIPRLTLMGFSRTGCLQAGIGGGLAYSTLLRPGVQLSLGAGVYHLPHAAPDGTSVTRSQVRADVFFASPKKGPTYSVGVSVSGNRGSLTFGGGF